MKCLKLVKLQTVKKGYYENHICHKNLDYEDKH